jgi:uncharacterized protein with NRDE domain
MCLLVVSWFAHRRYRLVVAANRDEFHERPTAPLGWWNDEPGILAGRDQRAGGTWLGVARSGRFGLVTNFRDAQPPKPESSPSRGELVPGFLRGHDDPQRYLRTLSDRSTDYAGFNLLLGDRQSLLYFTNSNGKGSRLLGPGVYGLSNHRLDEPWPKLVRTRERFTAALGQDDPSAVEFFDLLTDRTPAATDVVPDAGLPPELLQALSAPFVRHERYGTRCSTVLLVEHDGRIVVHERRFDAAGEQTGATRIEFSCAGG